MQNWHALIVEDEADSADVVSRVLTFHNISHIRAATGEEALDLLAAENPSLLIIDLALPGIDGWEFLRRVRADPATAHLPAVAVTAFHSTNVAEEAIKAGFTAYFPKPIDAIAFGKELERVLSE